MNTQTALQILIQAVHLATTKGAYNLGEAKIIAEAVEFFMKKPEEPKAEEKVETSKEKKK